MKIVISVLCIIYCVKWSLCITDRRDWISGSLEGTWTFDITVFMENFGSKIFECTDFEKNNLLLNATKNENGGTNIYLKFNRNFHEEKLQSLCGCDPCDRRLMKFDLIASETTVTVHCNNHGHFSISKVQFPVSEQDSPNDRKIYFTIASNRVGCLHSFFYNKKQISKLKFRNRFLEQCPRHCEPGICNNGICRALYATGPKCNCSNTTLNGQFCNKELRKYKMKFINSFRKTLADSNVEFKLSWRASTTSQYCLIQFVGEYHRVTLSIHLNRLLSGTKKISEIRSGDFNFIVVQMSNTEINFKVNGKVISHKLDFTEDITIHLGFSNTSESCNTFEGIYDFKLDTSQLLPLRHDRNPFHKVNIRKTLIISGTTILLTTIFYILLAILLFFLFGKKFTIQRNKPVNPQREIRHEQVPLSMKKHESSSNVYDEHDQFYNPTAPPIPTRR